MKKTLTLSTILSPLLFLLLLTGCAQITATNFVVLRNVPANPSFSVVPYNYNRNEVEFAHKIEEILLEFGIKVVKPPTPKEVVQAKGLTKAVDEAVIGDTLNKMIGEAVTVEAYMDFSGVNSDYFVFSDRRTERLRIIKIDSQEVLASFEIPSSQAPTQEKKIYDYKKVIHDGLKAIGISVRDLPEPPSKKDEVRK